jgi:sporulation integral membrane protein YlbJ
VFIFAAALLSGFILLMILVQPRRVIYIKKLTLPLFCISFILCLVLLSDTAVKAAVNGLKLWSGIVVPSLFPFFVAAEVLNATGFIRASGLLLEPVMRPLFNVPGTGSFALAMGVTSGYPVGAKITCGFRENGDLTRTEAERLLAFTNNSGPLFIVGAVGTGMYGSSVLGIFLLVCHFLSCITVGILFRFYKGRDHTPATGLKTIPGHTSANPLKLFKRKLLDDSGNVRQGIGITLGNAIRESVSTILAIGGFIVVFSVIITFLTDTGIIRKLADVLGFVLSPLGVDCKVVEGVLCGLFEITTGSNSVSSVFQVPLAVRLPAASFIIGWAGLSVHFQVMSIASKTDLSILPYLAGKLLQGFIAAFYTWIGLRLFHFEMIPDEPVLGITYTVTGWMNTFGNSLLLLAAVFALFLAAALLAFAGLQLRKGSYACIRQLSFKRGVHRK